MFRFNRIYRTKKSVNYFRNFFSYNIDAGGPGLFGLDNIRSPEDFPKSAQKAIDRSNELRHKISLYKNDNESLNEYSKELLMLMDQVSNEICGVIDAAEFCRCVHANDKFRSAAERAFEMLSSYIHILNSDSELYNKLVHIVNNKEIMSNLEEEDVIFALDLKHEFETEGIHLQDKKHLNQLQSQVVNYETTVSQNLIQPSNNSDTFPLGPVNGKNNSAVSIRNFLSNWISQPNLSPSSEDVYLNCPNNPRITNTMMSQILDDNLRKQLWCGTRRYPQSNVLAVGNLILERQQLAAHLGFDSHAHKVLKRSVLNTPEIVHNFLKDTADAVLPKSHEQLNELINLKKRIDTHTDPNDTKKTIINPWDIGFLQQLHRNARGTQSSALAELQQHMPLDRCLDGLFALLKDLFGIEFRQCELGSTESWAASNVLWKYEAFDEEGVPIGTVYLDLFARSNKMASPAHFTIRCGFNNGRIGVSDSSRDDSKDDGAYQLPIVALVFSMHRTSESSSPLLSLHELETLYHEWGHALHSLLSRTKYQHLSGTRGALDYVEVPSHLMEEFVRSPRRMMQWIGGANGVQATESLIEDALIEKRHMSSIDFQSQLLWAIGDQIAFGSKGVKACTGATNAESIYLKVEKEIAKMQADFTTLPLDDKEHPYVDLSSHGHVVNYGGGYYSYIYARMYAIQIFNKLFDDSNCSSSSNREGGKQLAASLQYGAARNPKRILEELAGPLDAQAALAKLL